MTVVSVTFSVKIEIKDPSGTIPTVARMEDVILDHPQYLNLEKCEIVELLRTTIEEGTENKNE